MKAIPNRQKKNVMPKKKFKKDQAKFQKSKKKIHKKNG